MREDVATRSGCDLADSVHGMAALFALGRPNAADGLRALRASHDVVLLDRYAASNAAYGAAMLHEDADGPFVEWVRALQVVDCFGVLVPDVQLLLRVPVTVAAAVARADGRAETDSKRTKDLHEIDQDLQARCAAVYDGLAANGWLARWSVADRTGSAGPTPSELASRYSGVSARAKRSWWDAT